jgi:hypothetical protein
MVNKRRRIMALDDVDVFHGNWEYELPPPGGVAASWFFLKAQTGNTHPGAVLLFSVSSACAYTGGYPTGYSSYWYNYHSRPERIMDPADLQAVGFFHFHHSGTGKSLRCRSSIKWQAPVPGLAPH